MILSFFDNLAYALNRMMWQCRACKGLQFQSEIRLLVNKGLDEGQILILRFEKLELLHSCQQEVEDI